MLTVIYINALTAGALEDWCTVICCGSWDGQAAPLHWSLPVVSPPDTESAGDCNGACSLGQVNYLGQIMTQPLHPSRALQRAQDTFLQCVWQSEGK